MNFILRFLKKKMKHDLSCVIGVETVAPVFRNSLDFFFLIKSAVKFLPKKFFLRNGTEGTVGVEYSLGEHTFSTSGYRYQKPEIRLMFHFEEKTSHVFIRNIHPKEYNIEVMSKSTEVLDGFLEVRRLLFYESECTRAPQNLNLAVLNPGAFNFQNLDDVVLNIQQVGVHDPEYLNNLNLEDFHFQDLNIHATKLFRVGLGLNMNRFSSVTAKPLILPSVLTSQKPVEISKNIVDNFGETISIKENFESLKNNLGSLHGIKAKYLPGSDTFEYLIEIEPNHSLSNFQNFSEGVTPKTETSSLFLALTYLNSVGWPTFLLAGLLSGFLFMACSLVLVNSKSPAVRFGALIMRSFLVTGYASSVCLVLLNVATNFLTNRPLTQKWPLIVYLQESSQLCLDTTSLDKLGKEFHIVRQSFFLGTALFFVVSALAKMHSFQSVTFRFLGGFILYSVPYTFYIAWLGSQNDLEFQEILFSSRTKIEKNVCDLTQSSSFLVIEDFHTCLVADCYNLPITF